MMHQAMHRRNNDEMFAEKIVHCFHLNVWWIVETSSHSPRVFRSTQLLDRINKSSSSNFNRKKRSVENMEGMWKWGIAQPNYLR